MRGLEYVLDNISSMAGQDTIGEVRRRVAARYPCGATAFVRTYGCQQNASDSQRLSGVLSLLGFAPTQDISRADFILLNTCAVRETAESRVFGNIGALKHLKEQRPDRLLAVGGCMAQQPHAAQRLRESYPYVDIVFGANAATRLPGLVLSVLEENRRAIDLRPPGESLAEGIPVDRGAEVRAWLPVMQGCDNFCTYCIVPYVRGRERSRRVEDILEEARGLIRQGYHEITLLGQNVNSYGKGLPEGSDFPRLLRAINSLEGDFRVRFMTSHPKDCSHALIDAVASCGKVCRQIHLPVQSGSDRVLARMNRRYTAGMYRELVGYAREKIPGVSLSSDIIVGFPGETREDFERTLALVRDVRFTSLFTFLYSPRSGTQAAQMEDPVPKEEKSRWFQELLRVQGPIGQVTNDAQVGNTLRVLDEGPAKKPCMRTGHAESGVTVEFTGEPRPGALREVLVTHAFNWALGGETVDN